MTSMEQYVLSLLHRHWLRLTTPLSQLLAYIFTDGLQRLSLLSRSTPVESSRADNLLKEVKESHRDEDYWQKMFVILDEDLTAAYKADRGNPSRLTSLLLDEIDSYFVSIFMNDRNDYLLMGTRKPSYLGLIKEYNQKVLSKLTDVAEQHRILQTDDASFFDGVLRNATTLLSLNANPYPMPLMTKSVVTAINKAMAYYDSTTMEVSLPVCLSCIRIPSLCDSDRKGIPPELCDGDICRCYPFATPFGKG